MAVGSLPYFGLLSLASSISRRCFTNVGRHVKSMPNIAMRISSSMDVCIVFLMGEQ